MCLAALTHTTTSIVCLMRITLSMLLICFGMEIFCIPEMEKTSKSFYRNGEKCRR